ncbi:MarR family transcriptional regulator [Paenibacillus athensensis]|uniref:MarR family transcriptional regulator n=1 Tax=Paenibacillus athensensis TaxID=1967502 RepID=A0A4Y8Q991_9BACL|nr:MarR family transcriptional regulator [Paenibacillus athensensis]MCD1260359.1 MarR family transcriptional regulator [Paenibacillus athensensis]
MSTEEQAASLKLLVVLSKAYKTIFDLSIKNMKQHGLSPSEFMILEVLYNKGRYPLQQIGEKILITSGSVTYNIDKLANKQLIRRVPCEADRRIIYAELTDEGRRLFDRVFPLHAEVMTEVLQGLSLDEKLQATELLKRLGKGAER